MSNSSLISYTRISSHKNSPRRNAIDRITPHCIVGQWTAKQGCDYFATVNRDVSSNYVIGRDGAIGLSVDEKDRSWCSSSPANDHRAITIECASDRSAPYRMNAAVFESLVKLCVDICRRHGKKKLLWIPNRSSALSYQVKPDEMLLTVHRWFSQTACPGDWLYQRLGVLASRVTAELGGKPNAPTRIDKEQAPAPKKRETYLVRVAVSALNIRKGAGTNYPITGTIRDRGVYTIVEEADGAGARKWGKLKSGAGWIALDYTKKL